MLLHTSPEPQSLVLPGVLQPPPPPPPPQPTATVNVTAAKALIHAMLITSVL